ncbi:SAM-dependent methyltransferase [Methylobacterium sp. Leaf87]|uniref:DUF938 domain-containing protein n=1 Tax=Methylobacterium sp. Leaf87 TaxID=1736243 RepID=UPI0006F8519A|nr:DUF938 domain-containing protein [Methylobacterium sp. Leaf87]KQO70750.1 SAM-dependent methyltransferase [Methylobacterium sp. Leaf87]
MIGGVMGGLAMSDDEALYAPAVPRNREPIGAALASVLPRFGTVLEVASGTGEHALHWAATFPHLIWQPSDPDPVARRSIVAHTRAAACANLRPPLDLDVSMPHWPISRADAIVCINMIHIAPWAATPGLMAGAVRLLPPGGVLVLYGPFREHGVRLANSNAAFDADLRARDPAWGLRDLSAVTRAAEAHGLALSQHVAMPANNLFVVFRKVDPAR